MNLIFMGAARFAEPSLVCLSELGANIVCVYTKPPKPGGRRGLGETRTVIHRASEALGLRVETPASLRNPAVIESMAQLAPDLVIVASYGLILPREVLDLPKLGCVNLHASLLPRWRGAAPVQRAILAQDEETGVSLMRMEVGLDTGPIAGQLRTSIGSSETASELTDRLSLMAAQSLRDNWKALCENRLQFIPQASEGITYAHKIEKGEAAIDWSAPGSAVRAQINALSPFPGAYTELRIGSTSERLKVLKAELLDTNGRPGEILDNEFSVGCGGNSVRLLIVQRAGRAAISGAEFMRSRILRIGDTLPTRVGVPS